MRLALLCLLLAACHPTAARDNAGGDDVGDDGSAFAECQVDDQCAPAAATCCECPTFAVPTSDPLYQTCTGVACPGNTCADNVTAACREGACQLVCKPMACDASCDEGFATDATGCLTCACATPPDAGACVHDTDCVEVRADCCGCAKGGADTAVLAADAAAHDAMLGCPANPQCPSTNVCALGVEPQCVLGHCELLAAEALPPDACGRADLPACPAGTACTVNADPAADAHGVGVCR